MTDSHDDQLMLEICLRTARNSLDPSTGVGALIVPLGPTAPLRCFVNGFPRFVPHNIQTVDRDTKLKYVVHAEMWALANAAKCGLSTNGATMYIACCGADGIWGGPPCVRCVLHCLTAGIEHFVSYAQNTIPSRWHADLAESLTFIERAGATFRTVELPE